MGTRYAVRCAGIARLTASRRSSPIVSVFPFSSLMFPFSSLMFPFSSLMFPFSSLVFPFSR
jgi:hypothetical protein